MLYGRNILKVFQILLMHLVRLWENADGSGYTFVGGQDDSDSYDHNMSEEEWQQSQKQLLHMTRLKIKLTVPLR